MPSGSDLYNYYLSQGLDSIHAAAITGNVYGESSYNPNAVGDGGSAYGLFQLHPDRQAGFEAVTGTPINESTWQQQAGYALTEMRNSPYLAGSFFSETTLAGATAAFEKSFERPADPSASFGSRLGAATNVLNGAESTLSTIGTTAKDAALEALDKALENVPIIGQIWSGAKKLGVPDIFTASEGECGINPVCYLEKWFRETQFIPRLAFFVLGAILLIGAIVFFAKDTGVGKEVVKAGALAA